MSTHTTPAVNKGYITAVSFLTFLLPVIATAIEAFAYSQPFTFGLFGKWFIFSAVGIRLLAAGTKQVKDPAFTAKQIFHIENAEVHPIVRELGFANLCFGLLGILSVWMPQWRVASAFASGIYYGLAGLLHLLKKPAGVNEQFALITDMIIFGILLAYFIKFI
ncbi:MAG: hypothetical protein QM731_02555 [Chitinophagaceae bacterium]